MPSSGGVTAAFGWRIGSGLAGGAGLAIAGLAALTIGLAQVPVDAAHDLAAIPTENRFTLTITLDLGYWLQIAAGVPLQCDEPLDFKSFRLGLFGLDKLHNVERTVATLEQVLDQIIPG